MPQLDRKANEVFGGKVVRKDLVRKIKVGANVPVYVLEYLLGRYCATDDPQAVDVGLRLVNDTLAENYVRPDEAQKAQSLVEQRGRHTFIDKVKVRFLPSEDKYWAELVNFGYKFVHIPTKFIQEYDRLLEGGVWAQVAIEYRRTPEEERSRKHPFYIEDVKPIQVASFDREEYREGRRAFGTEEWIDLLVRSVGLEPAHFSRRLKVLFLTRLLPMVEANYNFVELGPRGTGKSFVYQEISPYVILLTGPTTVANLFYNMSTAKMGLVAMWDAVGFDEVADLESMPKEVVTTLKTYCESGTFARGKEALTAAASIAFFGNLNQPVDVLVRSAHLFQPMPEVIRGDMAFLDRMHFYLPGWEIPKMHNEFLTDHYGFVVDYLAEAFRVLRKENYADILDRSFSLGSHLNTRDSKAVRRTVSGLMKILHPSGEFSKEDLREVVEVALEGRRRVKEQLKKMGSFEYHQTSFSYVDNETREERFVGVPEEGGRDLIAQDPLAPGTVYTSGIGADGKVGLYRIEVSLAPGTGKLRLAGGMEPNLKQAAQRTFAYMQTAKEQLALSPDIDRFDIHVQGVGLTSVAVPCESGVAVFVAVFSALKRRSVLPALLILGDLTIQGNLKGVPSLSEPLRVAMDNSAKRVLIPLENKRHFLEVPGDVMERVDPIFYADPVTAARKAIGLH